jgi:hypothetical protein
MCIPLTLISLTSYTNTSGHPRLRGGSDRAPFRRVLLPACPLPVLCLPSVCLLLVLCDPASLIQAKQPFTASPSSPVTWNLRSFADSVFIEDTCVYARHQACVTQPGAPTRRGECARVHEALGDLALSDWTSATTRYLQMHFSCCSCSCCCCCQCCYYVPPAVAPLLPFILPLQLLLYLHLPLAPVTP